MEVKHLLLIAEARMRVAGAVLLFVPVILAWGYSNGSPQQEEAVMTCGVVINHKDWPTYGRFYQGRYEQLFGQAVDPDNGEHLFKGDCASCHHPSHDMNGPALKDLISRVPRPGVDWYVAYTTNSDSLVRMKEPYTLALRENWNNSTYHHHSTLDRKRLVDILAYVEWSVIQRGR